MDTKQLWKCVKLRARRAPCKRSNASTTRAKKLDHANALDRNVRRKKLSVRLVDRGSHAHNCGSTHIGSEASTVDPRNRWNYNIDPGDANLPAIPKLTPFTPAEILKALKKFPRSSAADWSGLSLIQIQKRLRFPSADCTNGLQEILGKGPSILADDDGLILIPELIGGAPLTALRKEDDVFSPIAVGEKYDTFSVPCCPPEKRSSPGAY